MVKNSGRGVAGSRDRHTTRVCLRSRFPTRGSVRQSASPLSRVGLSRGIQFMGLLAIIACSLFAFAAAGAIEPKAAPLSEEYEKYLEEGPPLALSEDGHLFGYVPPPVDLSHLYGGTGSGLSPLRPMDAHPASFDLRTSGPGGTSEVDQPPMAGPLKEIV